MINLYNANSLYYIMHNNVEVTDLIIQEGNSKPKASVPIQHEKIEN